MNKSLQRSVTTGGFGFALASLCVFATVAYGEGWMYKTLGLSGAYIAWTLMFILLGGAVFTSIVSGSKWRFPRFYILFAAAFFLYAVGWVGAYFTLRGKPGEWVGSLAGSVLMAIIFAAGFGALRSTIKLAAILFVANSAGYFIGSWLNDTVHGAPGMLLWGVVYGLFLGAGIAAVLHLAQHRR
jgi:hypothetical protein